MNAKYIYGKGRKGLPPANISKKAPHFEPAEWREGRERSKGKIEKVGEGQRRVEKQRLDIIERKREEKKWKDIEGQRRVEKHKGKIYKARETEVRYRE